MKSNIANTQVEVNAATKPTAHWFYGTVGNKEEFYEYVTSTYSRSKCLSIIPTELVEIAKEALEFGKYFKLELASHFQDIVVDVLAFSAEAVNRGLDPQPSEITEINERAGTDFRNMIEFYEAQEKKPELAGFANHGFPVVASKETTEADSDSDDAEDIEDEEAYIRELTNSDDEDDEDDTDA